MSLASPELLHVPTGAGCNNHCNFCMERSAGYDGGLTRDDFFGILATHRGRLDDVVFTGGEPTLNPLLPELVERACALDYGVIGLVTNGRRLKDRDYTALLLGAGLNQVTVSIHGPTAAVHDPITGRRGSFAQAAAGLANLAALSDAGVTLRVNCTLVRHNLAHMEAMHAFALQFADEINFNVAEPRGHADDGFAEVVPRYTEVLEAADASGLDFRTQACSLSRMPACAGGLEWVQETWHLAHADAVDVFDDRDGKVRGPPCEACALSRCGGVWARYIAGYGWDEMIAVHPARPLHEAVRVEGDPVGRALRRGFLRGYRSVVLASDLAPRWVGQARDFGFERVVLETAGVGLHARWFQETAVHADEVVVCLHGLGDAHDQRVGCPGAFRTAVATMMLLQRFGVPFAMQAPNDAAWARRLAEKTGAARLESMSL